MVWVAFALMTAAAVLCLVWPLASQHKARSEKTADLAFYASQLAEVEGDIDRGIVTPGEAETTRAEIGRRLLVSARREEMPRGSGGMRLQRAVAVGASVLLVPAVALGLYLRIGNPGQPDEPVASRPDAGNADLASAIPKIEAHLVSHPDDGRGFELIAPIYLRMGRYDDAARAFEASLRVLGETGERRAALGQALVLAADGVVTDEARAAFVKALADDPKLPQARFFLAMASEQDGDKPKAIAQWQALAADTPPDASWRTSVEQHLAVLNGQAPPAAPAAASAGLPAPTGPAAASIAAMPADQRLQAIQGMVDGLAGRLAQNGRDVEGWLRLIKAYTVLGEQDKARGALANARKGLDGDTSALAQVEALATELNLGG